MTGNCDVGWPVNVTSITNGFNVQRNGSLCPQISVCSNKGRPSNHPAVRTPFTVLRAPLLAIFVIACGCRGGETIWGTEARSPDGQWLAVARTDQYSGPGNAALITAVSLKRMKGPKSPIDVLEVFQNSRSMDLKLNWLTSKHLEVSYREPVAIEFQAIKAAGIDISLNDVSGRNP